MRLPHLLQTALLAGLTLCAAGCEQEAALEPESLVVGAKAKGYPGVDEALWLYFERFEREAAARSVRVDLGNHNLGGRIVEIVDSEVAGDCHYDPDAPDRLRVDESFWLKASDRLREYVVFHELGHCALVRDHREDADAQGYCLSVMASGTGDCNEAYSPTTREALLDELFDEGFAGDWE